MTTPEPSPQLVMTGRPPFAIVDAHVHIWDPDELDYAWHATVPALDRSYVLDDYRDACGDVEVDRIVFVQAECDPGQAIDEARWVDRQANDDPRLQAIVAFAPIDRGSAVATELEALSTISRVRGVRRLLQDDPDRAACARPEFVEGVQALAEFGYSFDLCIYHDQLAPVVELVARCPRVTFILDHIAKPAIKRGEFDPWRRELRELAALPNVWCKLSGVATEADHDSWTTDQLAPYVEHALDCFGFERVMFGSDWPVATLATTIPRWVETVVAVTDGCSERDRSRLFRDNAIEAYRLGA